MIYELDYNLTLVQSGIKVTEGEAAINAKISEWFATPMFTLADSVKWGHPLRQFQFDPIADILEIEVEMVVSRKIKQDIPGLDVRYIGVQSSSGIDQITIAIVHNYGIFKEDIVYSEGSNGAI